MYVQYMYVHVHMLYLGPGSIRQELSPGPKKGK